MKDLENVMFKGIMPALITPFDEEGKLKVETVSKLINWHLDNGVKGFYICGNTGEGPALNVAIRKEMAEVVVAEKKKRPFVIIDHVGSPYIHDSIELTRHACSLDIDAISSLLPQSTLQYSEDEIVNYYSLISKNSTKPLLVYATAIMEKYNVPRLIGRLMKLDGVVGSKFTLRDYSVLRTVKELNGGNINIINGPDETLLCGLVMGADGGIGGTYNIMSDLFVKLYDAYISGDLALAQQYQYKIDRIINILKAYSPGGTLRALKASLNLMGFNVGNATSPALELSKETALNLKSELEEAGLNFNI